MKVRDARRKASGCSKNPCNNKKLPFGKHGNSCDEFPFASVKEGGKGAHLRCVRKGENSSEYTPRFFVRVSVVNGCQAREDNFVPSTRS